MMRYSGIGSIGFILAIAILRTGPVLGAPTSKPTSAGSASAEQSRGDKMLDAYFRGETAKLSDRCLADIHTLDDWTSRRALYRQQLAEMLGLWPEPERTDLKPVITGRVQAVGYIVEKLQFQSRPGLYVTADFYLPSKANEALPVPAILYVCGHSLVKVDGISCGNKTGYQHHGEWFARNGYACLVVDTLQLGEIEGIHHGLYRENMWWWLSRGYTPAGVEAWTGIRCLDYLQSRKEVDAERIGMTGRSGGGAYTWYTAALDERVKVVVPVAGITDLQNHVVDGCITGHCDCMYMTNTYRWDFPQVAALIAPRPMLISNSDKDSIFPLDGVVRLHGKVRDIYKLYKADDKLGLLVTEGPHKDTQELRLPAFRWFNRFLKNEVTDLKDISAEKTFGPLALRVFPPKLEPADQINTTIQETFIPSAKPKVPDSQKDWEPQRDRWLATLKCKTFAGWPTEAIALDVEKSPAGVATSGDAEISGVDFTSQQSVRLSMVVIAPKGKKTSVRLVVADEAMWLTLTRWLMDRHPDLHRSLRDNTAMTDYVGDRPPLSATFPADALTKGEAVVWLAPRGVGPTLWTYDPKRETHILRRFALLGQTLEGMQTYDVRRAIQAIWTMPDLADVPLTVAARYRLAGVALYASLFEPKIDRLELQAMPATHRDGPDLLNVMKTLDLPAAVALAAERSNVQLTKTDPPVWSYPQAVREKLGWPVERLTITGK